MLQPKRPPLSVCVKFPLIFPHILKIYTIYHTILLLIPLIFSLRDSLMKNNFFKTLTIMASLRNEEYTVTESVCPQIFFPQWPLKLLVSFQPNTGTRALKDLTFLQRSQLGNRKQSPEEKQLCPTSSYTQAQESSGKSAAIRQLTRQCSSGTETDAFSSLPHQSQVQCYGPGTEAEHKSQKNKKSCFSSYMSYKTMCLKIAGNFLVKSTMQPSRY